LTESETKFRVNEISTKSGLVTKLSDRCDLHTNIYNTPMRNKVQNYKFAGSFNKKAVLPQGNRAMPQVFFSVEVRQQHSLQV